MLVRWTDAATPAVAVDIPPVIAHVVEYVFVNIGPIPVQLARDVVLAFWIVATLEVFAQSFKVCDAVLVDPLVPVCLVWLNDL